MALHASMNFINADTREAMKSCIPCIYSISLLISKKSNQPTQQKFTVVIASNKLLYQQHPAMHNLLMVAYLDNKNRLSKETGDATKTCCCNFASNNKI